MGTGVRPVAWDTSASVEPQLTQQSLYGDESRELTQQSGTGHLGGAQ